MKEKMKVIKIGSHVLNNDSLLKECLTHFASIEGKKILIHGGGDFATQLSEKLKIPVKKIEGRRVTTAETLEIIVMAYAGKINKNIVSVLQALDCNCIGLTGADGNSIQSQKRKFVQVDYGFAGDIDSINTEVIEAFLNLKLTPVFCAITHDKNGQLLNTNADTIASEIASAFSKKYDVELMYVSEKKGVLSDLNNANSVILQINDHNFKKLKEDKIISNGMLPKIETALKSVLNGVSKICIGDISILENKKSSFTTIVTLKK